MVAAGEMEITLKQRRDAGKAAQVRILVMIMIMVILLISITTTITLMTMMMMMMMMDGIIVLLKTPKKSR